MHILLKYYIFLFTLFFIQTSLEAQSSIKTTLYYKTNHYELSPSMSQQLIAVIDSIDSKKSISNIKIEGFCDDIGSLEYNKELSLKRALCVKVFLEDNMNSQKQYSVYNKAEISIDNSSGLPIKKQRELNRKVEITIYYQKNYSETLFNSSSKIGDKVVLNEILFEPNTSKLLESSYPALLHLIEELKNNPQIDIQIQGHIHGPYKTYRMYNSYTRTTLSEERAKFVYDFLIKHNIDKNRLSYVGLGAKFPLNKGPKHDIRVEIEIMDKKK